MLAEHTNKEKMPCKPQSRYHLKGYVIIVIGVTAALLTVGGKTRKGQSTHRNSMLAEALTVYHHCSHLSQAYLHPHVYTWPAVYPTCTSSVCYSRKQGEKHSCCHLCPATGSCLEGSCPSTLPGLQQAGSEMVPGISTGVGFAKRHSRALYQFKGNTGSVIDHFTFLETP